MEACISHPSALAFLVTAEIWLVRTMGHKVTEEKNK